MFKIITENLNQEGIKNLLESEGMDYTLYPAQGSYHNKPEESLIIDLEQPEEKVMKIAQDIAVLNNQDSVLVEEIPSSFRFVKQEG